MEIKTYRAKSMRDALELVRRELGPSAAVLHTREVNSGLLGRVLFGRQYEVAASYAVNVPSRLPAAEHRAWSMEQGPWGDRQRKEKSEQGISQLLLHAPST